MRGPNAVIVHLSAEREKEEIKGEEKGFITFMVFIDCNHTPGPVSTLTLSVFVGCAGDVVDVERNVFGIKSRHVREG